VNAVHTLMVLPPRLTSDGVTSAISALLLVESPRNTCHVPCCSKKNPIFHNLSQYQSGSCGKFAMTAVSASFAALTAW